MKLGKKVAKKLTHPKLLWKFSWLFYRTMAFSRQIRTFPQRFRFLSIQEILEPG